MHKKDCVFQTSVGDITPGVLRIKTIPYLMYGKETWYFNSIYDKSLASTNSKDVTPQRYLLTIKETATKIQLLFPW